MAYFCLRMSMMKGAGSNLGFLNWFSLDKNSLIWNLISSSSSYICPIIILKMMILCLLYQIYIIRMAMTQTKDVVIKNHILAKLLIIFTIQQYNINYNHSINNQKINGLNLSNTLFSFYDVSWCFTTFTSNLPSSKCDQ